jgi:hypothetical protein
MTQVTEVEKSPPVQLPSGGTYGVSRQRPFQDDDGTASEPQELK